MFKIRVSVAKKACTCMLNYPVQCKNLVGAMNKTQSRWMLESFIAGPQNKTANGTKIIY